MRYGYTKEEHDELIKIIESLSMALRSKLMDLTDDSGEGEDFLAKTVIKYKDPLIPCDLIFRAASILAGIYSYRLIEQGVTTQQKVIDRCTKSAGIALVDGLEFGLQTTGLSNVIEVSFKTKK